MKRYPSITSPADMQDGWSVGSLRDASIDSVRLFNLLRRVCEDEYPGIDGILIARNSKLVFEEYFRGYDFEYSAKGFKGRAVEYDSRTLHNLASVTKSVTGLLRGIAHDKGFIRSVDERVSSFFPEDTALFSDQKNDITLHHLLTMSSGLHWNEQDVSISDPKNDLIH